MVAIIYSMLCYLLFIVCILLDFIFNISMGERMKSGFYLSPCGRYIVEIFDNRMHFSERLFDYWGYFTARELEIVFSCWEILE
jgi:hypothetical protein